ncbi:hypothetical protein OSTOST_24933 [Ostertagia ostertagi]
MNNSTIHCLGLTLFPNTRFSCLYAIYTETPERRRINALFVIVLVTLFLAFVHFFMSIALLYGAIKDVFNEQLTMSVAEFVMSLAVNGICLIVVIFFYWRLIGRLTSDKPAHSRGASRSRAVS